MCQAMPGEDILYLGDTARVPYGTKSANTVIRYSLQTSQFLLDRGVKYLVVACNTASAQAMEALQREIPVPVMGVVKPGARAAAASTQCGKVGVIGTLGTVESGAYHRAIHEINPSLTVFGEPCPLLVPLAEEGWVDHSVTHQVARHYLTELRLCSGDLDTIVLGCTHYPLLRETLSREAEEIFGHPVSLIDSADAVSADVAEDLQRRGLRREGGAPGSIEFFFTDVSRFSEVAARFMGRDIPEPRHADI